MNSAEIINFDLTWSMISLVAHLFAAWAPFPTFSQHQGYVWCSLTNLLEIIVWTECIASTTGISFHDDKCKHHASSTAIFEGPLVRLTLFTGFCLKWIQSWWTGIIILQSANVNYNSSFWNRMKKVTVTSMGFEKASVFHHSMGVLGGE